MVSRQRNREVIDVGQMCDDLLLVVGEVCLGYRHRSFPQSSSASLFTAGAAGAVRLIDGLYVVHAATIPV
jgi:hypothetical protein